MKHHICFLIFIMTSTHSIAMDLPEPKQRSLSLTQQKNERIASISQAINKAIENTSLCCGLCTKSFSERDHFDLLNYVNSCYKEKEMYEDDIDRLKKKNLFFAATIDYFCDIAKENYATVTLNTLNIITDHQQPQPIKKLDALAPTLKKYIMNMAYHKIRRVHSIEFVGHTAPVRRVAINTQKNLACSASKDGTFRLWDLETGKALYTLNETAVNGYVKFNDAGTLLATATLSREQPFEITIKIWDPHSQKSLWNIKHHNRFSALAFFQEQTNITLAVLGQNNSTLYALKEHQELVPLGMSTNSIPMTVDKGYKVKKSKEKDNYTWIAEKSAPRLYLCERAIENTAVPTVFNMQKISLYKDLLESEKQMVDTLFNTKFSHSYISIN